MTAAAEPEPDGAGPGRFRACLFGTGGAPANLGVAALRAAALDLLLTRLPDARITVFDDGWGQRPGQAHVAGRPRPVRLVGARRSRRVHRPESYLNMRVSAAFGGLGNAGLAAIDAADAVFDLSGGDSFTDGYGERRFRMVAWPKRLALLRGRPLVLLPQTYGPFRSPRLRQTAAGLVRGAAMAWARDPDSYAALGELLGPDLDPARHRSGVDLAFALRPHEPAAPARDAVAAWLAAARGPVIGLNVSGLLTRAESMVRFRLRSDCLRVARLLAAEVLAEPDTRVLLVPHVRAPGKPDDDTVVTERLHEQLARRYGDRVALAPAGLDPHQTKWLIGRTDWFCGMRMHAAIAALSCGVPAAVLAYSDKAAGVFAVAGQRRWVADARRCGDEELVAHLRAAWRGRAATAADLAGRLPAVRSRVDDQLDAILALVGPQRPVPIGG
ncbi:polysaccharide pyruvyl transferase family protein [Plantactinospora siamensis]|uniref:Polysaccharide pyruvyl transferase family protein n=1 Tax=Plantactinospora siamensis TaxID=555372 RepID=A0ABV6NXQ3_9ACTN